MLLTTMPMFELFLPLFKNYKIEKWTASDFWRQLKISKKERNNCNRQRIYRLLRTLVAEGFLTKDIHPTNSCLSTFSETDKLNELRECAYSSIDFMQMKKIQEENEEAIVILEKKIQVFNQLKKQFPNSISHINIQKMKCLDKLINLRAYSSALDCILTS